MTRRDPRLPTPLPGGVDPLDPSRLRQAAIFPPVPGVGSALALLTAFAVRGTRSAEAGRQLRQILEGLGGLWVPFGQLVARQTVRFSPEFCEELKTTRQPPIVFSFAETRRIVEDSLGASLERRFTAFETEPFATLPFAQIYRARIRRGSRERDVTVRVLAPGTRERLARDMARIRWAIRVLETMGVLASRYVPEMLEELDATRTELCDYRYEVAHLRRLRRSLRGHRILLLRAYRPWCSTDVLTCDLVEAPSLNELREAYERNPAAVRQWCRDNGINGRKIGRRLLESYLRQICEEADFERNLLPQHFLLLRDNRLMLVGMRSARTLHGSFRAVYAMLLRSISLSQYEKTADCLFLLCDALPSIDLAEVKQQLVALLRSYSARAALRPADPDEKSLFVLLRSLARVLERNGVYLTWQFFDVQLGWSRVDETIRLLMPQEDMLRRIDKYYQRAQQRRWAQMSEKGLLSSAAGLLGRVSEFAMFQGADLRRRARVFRAVVGKGPFLFATFLGIAKWVLAAIGFATLATLVRQVFPQWVPSLAEPALAAFAVRTGPLPSTAWLVAAAGLAGARLCARLANKLLEPEPVGQRSR
jgi:ubiquinone biosynthesis protein